MPGQTALAANLMSQIIAEVTSLPRGVVNIFTESGNTGAPHLVASTDVQVISYTGSIAVGRIVAANGAATLKRMGLAAGIFTNSINISRRVSREIQAGTIWTDAWAELNDGFAEGGYKQSGIGRLRGPLAITEFQEAKTVVHAIPQLQG